MAKESFELNCNYTCWECTRDCIMKTMMRNLPESTFNKYILQTVKSTAGMNITMYQWSSQKANDFVMQNTVAISLARKKYLETLKNR